MRPCSVDTEIPFSHLFQTQLRHSLFPEALPDLPGWVSCLLQAPAAPGAALVPALPTLCHHGLGTVLSPPPDCEPQEGCDYCHIPSIARPGTGHRAGAQGMPDGSNLGRGMLGSLRETLPLLLWKKFPKWYGGKREG